MPKRKYSNKQMQIQLYKYIFNDFSVENTQVIIKKICGSFDLERCQMIFKQFFQNIFYTLTVLLKKENKIKDKKNLVFLPIDLKKDISNIEHLSYLFQDHSFGTFNRANLAWLTYALINNIDSK